MDEGPLTHPGVPEETYHKLGKKTLWIFIFERIHAAGLLLLLSIALFVLSQQSFLSQISPKVNLVPYVILGYQLCFLLFIATFCLIFFISWLIYINYKFCLGEDSLKIKRGILNKEEVAIPYRQIQDVDIRRDISFQMMGLSRIVILTAGHDEDEKPGDDESEGILPALDKDLAEWLQAELLRRANVQKVVEDKDAPEKTT